MKFLLIGCLHGKIPKELISVIKKENIDFILSTGDFYNFDTFRNLIFKYWDEIDGDSSNLASIIGIKKYNNLLKKYRKSGRETLRRLNKLNIPIITVYGNTDTTNKTHWAKYNRNFTKNRGETIEGQIKRLRNIRLLEYSSIKIKDYIIYGFGIKYQKRIKAKKPDKELKIYKLIAKEERNKLEEFFKKVDPRKVILLTHDPPENTKFDKVLLKESPAFNTHVGDFIVKEIIKKYQPLIHISGHMHEHQGKAYLGKTLMISHGAAQFGKFAILELNGKIKVKFVR